jgi:hypothetical protein
MSVVIVIAAVIVIVAVAVPLSMRASRRRATSHMDLPELGSLSKAANQTDGGVRHTNAEQHTEAEESKS